MQTSCYCIQTYSMLVFSHAPPRRKIYFKQPLNSYGWPRRLKIIRSTIWAIRLIKLQKFTYVFRGTTKRWRNIGPEFLNSEHKRRVKRLSFIINFLSRSFSEIVLKFQTLKAIRSFAKIWKISDYKSFQIKICKNKIKVKNFIHLVTTCPLALSIGQ